MNAAAKTTSADKAKGYPKHLYSLACYCRGCAKIRRVTAAARKAAKSSSDSGAAR